MLLLPYNWWYLRKQTLLKDPTCIRTYRKSFCFNIFLQKLSCCKRGELSINILFSQEFGRRRRRQWHPTPALLPGKSCGRRSLVGCSPWGLEKSDTTERLHFHFSLSCIGEGNGNPLQCPCPENPRDGEPGGLPSMGLHRVGHDWSDLAAAAAAAAERLALSPCLWWTT